MTTTEANTMTTEYVVSIRTGTPPDGWRTVRANKSPDVDGAISLIEGFTEHAAARNGVIWTSEEPDQEGNLYGQGDGGATFWNINVSPPLPADDGDE